MRYFRVKNFEKFQHFKKERPPWIKLYTDLFQDREFMSLSETHRYQIIMIWGVASRCKNRIPEDISYLSRLLNTYHRVKLGPLFEKNFLEYCEDSVKMDHENEYREEKRRDREEAEKQQKHETPPGFHEPRRSLRELIKKKTPELSAIISKIGD